MPKDYEVGYGKPPVPTRWPKGVSGNPRGREKGHKGLKTDLESTLNAVQTLENKLTGKKSKARNQLHAIQRLVERSALGDLKAQALLWPMLINVLGVDDRHKGARRLSAQDEAILAELLSERVDGDNSVPLLTSDHNDERLPDFIKDADGDDETEEDDDAGAN